MFKKNFLILDDLTKNQKSAFVSHLNTFTKKFSTLSCEDIWYKFLDEQEYLYNIKKPMYDWLYPLLSDDKLEKDAKSVIYDTLNKLKYKEKMKPYLDKQKLLAKEARKRASEWRQSHEKPTAKQLSYYKSLCKQLKVDGINLAEKSKLDLKNMISELLDKKGANSEL